MMNLCPCLQELIKKFTKPKGETSYEGARQFEEEEFINPQYREDNPLKETLSKPHVVSTNQAKSKLEKEKNAEKAEEKLIKLKELPQYFEEEEVAQHNEEADLLDVKVELQPAPVEDNIEDLIRYELNLTPAQPSPKIQPLPVVQPEPQAQQAVFEPEPLELNE